MDINYSLRILGGNPEELLRSLPSPGQTGNRGWSVSVMLNKLNIEEKRHPLMVRIGHV